MTYKPGRKGELRGKGLRHEDEHNRDTDQGNQKTRRITRSKNLTRQLEVEQASFFF